MHTTLLLSTFLLAMKVQAAKKCEADVYPKNANLELTPTEGTQWFQDHIKGTIEILDGCRFQVKGFTFQPVSGFTRWMGRDLRNSTKTPIRVSELNVIAHNNLDSPVYTLTDAAGREANFNDFSQFELYDEIQDVVLATAGPIPEIGSGVTGGSGNSNNGGNSDGADTGEAQSSNADKYAPSLFAAALTIVGAVFL